MNWRFLAREARAGSPQLPLFLLCVTCAVLAVACVGGWRATIETAMARDSRQTAGGDVVAISTLPLSHRLEGALAPYHGVLTQEMFTVAVAPNGQTLFCKLKAVDPGYPLYGEVSLASGEPLQAALKHGLVVESKVLERLGLKVGEQLKVGNRSFLIRDVFLQEPDRPLSLFGISPRIFLAASDLESTGLVQARGSYLERRVHLRLPDPTQADEVADKLRAEAVPDQERVESWKRPPVTIRRFVDNFFMFLDLVAAFTVALGGLGMQGTLQAWLRNRQTAIALVRTLGARNAWVVRHYSLLVAAVTLPGIALGLGLAALLLHLSAGWLNSLLPGQGTPTLSLLSALQAAGLGALVAAGFTVLPLRALRHVRPGQILRHEPLRSSRWSVVLGFLTTSLLLLAMIAQPQRALYCAAGLTTLVGVSWLLARLGLASLKRWHPRALALRTALKGLVGAAPSVTVLGATLAVLFALALGEQALEAAWVEAMPPGAPNLIFFDIQPNQAKGFEAAFGEPIKLYPSLRARFRDVDEQPIPRASPREYWERDARREFRGSSLPELDEDERLVGADKLFTGPDQVSLLDSVADLVHARVGSKVTLTIQGVPTELTVSSLRHVVKESFRPTFDLLFPAELVADAPRTIFATARVDEALVGPLQSKIAKAYPSISSMDVSETIRLVARKLGQMVTLVRFLLLMGVLAGVVILVSSALASRLERQREAAYYKVLGANRRFVLSAVLAENLVLGGLSAGIGMALALSVTGSLCHWLWDVPFPFRPGIWTLMMLVPAVLIAALGGWVARPVLNSRPAQFLTDEA